MSVGWQLAFFVAGLVTGWGFPLRRRRNATSASETPEQSLARLQGRGRVMAKGSGFTAGPQPKARPGSSPPAPRGGGGVSPGVWPTGPGAAARFDQLAAGRPAGMPTRGTSTGAGQAYGGRP